MVRVRRVCCEARAEILCKKVSGAREKEKEKRIDFLGLTISLSYIEIQNPVKFFLKTSII